MITINNKMFDIAHILIKTGESNPSQINKEYKTALMLAIENNMIETIHEIIDTGKSNIGYVNKRGETAAILATKQNLFDVLLVIIEYQNSNIEYINKYKESVLSLLKKNKETINNHDNIKIIDKIIFKIITLFRSGYINFYDNYSNLNIDNINNNCKSFIQNEDWCKEILTYLPLVNE
jgi:ankyrin repeat protein